MRNIREQPFCWQEKKILRFLRKRYTKSTLVKMRTLYLTLTEVSSDFNNQDIKYYTKTIATYSGLSQDWIPTGLKELIDLNIVQVSEERDSKGLYTNKTLIFTPENIQEIPPKPVTGKPGNGFTVTGESDSLEDNNPKEDISILEDNNNISQNSNSDAIRLTQLLFDCIKERKMDFKTPDLNQWAIIMNRMIRLDPRKPETVEAVIRWCQADDFWQDNILSPVKLREHFDQLELKMKKAEYMKLPKNTRSNIATYQQMAAEEGWDE